MSIILLDDGTMDTVLECTKCGDEIRYNYDGGDETGQTYDQFVDWAIEDAEDHDCER